MIYSKIVRVEQETANNTEVERILNVELEKLQKNGATINNIQVAVGRDADTTSGLLNKYSVTFVILYTK